MLWDPSLRTLYKLAERVEGDELIRVQEAIAKRRSELDLADLGESPLGAAAAEARETREARKR